MIRRRDRVLFPIADRRVVDLPAAHLEIRYLANRRRNDLLEIRPDRLGIAIHRIGIALRHAGRRGPRPSPTRPLPDPLARPHAIGGVRGQSNAGEYARQEQRFAMIGFHAVHLASLLRGIHGSTPVDVESACLMAITRLIPR